MTNAKQEIAPLAGPDLDLRTFNWMRLDIVHLRNSTTWIKAKDTPAARVAMINLWMAAWHQVPAGSLPNDPELLKHFADVPDFETVRDLALNGFKLCTDGRLYHPVLVEFATQSLAAVEERRARAINANRIRWDKYYKKHPTSWLLGTCFSQESQLSSSQVGPNN